MAAFGVRVISPNMSFYLYRSLDIKQGQNDAIALIACSQNAAYVSILSVESRYVHRPLSILSQVSIV